MNMTAMNRKRVVIAALLVCLVTVFVYLPALQNGFVNWDDPDYVYKNQHIKSIDLKSLKWMFTTSHTTYWHPLTWLSHAVDYAVWELDPMGHHLTSVIIHGLNAMLVVMIAAYLISFVRRDDVSDGRDNEHAPIIAAVITGLLFGIHPLRVESVVWVTERKDVLCAFFFLLSIFAYLKYAYTRSHSFGEVAAGGGAGRKYYVYSLILFMMALMSKPMAVTLPIVMIILDVYPFQRLEIRNMFRSQRMVLAEKVPFIALSIFSSVLTVMALSTSAGGARTQYSFWERFWNILKSLSFFLEKMVYPVKLIPLYPYSSDISVFTLEYFGPFMLVLGITIFCAWRWNKEKYWSVLWAYYLVTLLPVLGIIGQGGPRAPTDRFSYLPGLAPTLLAGLGVMWLWKRAGSSDMRVSKRAAVVVSIIFIVCILSFMTVKQTKIWKDSLSLWNSQLAVHKTGKAFEKRGLIYKELKEYEKAIADYNMGIELRSKPKHRKRLFNNRGNVYSELGKYQKALADYNMAVELDSGYERAYYNRGAVHLKLGRFQEAIMDFSEVIKLNPKHGLAYTNRGSIYKIFKKYEKAISDFNKNIEIYPEHALSYNNRGTVYLELKKHEKALADFNKAIELDPEYVLAYNNRGAVYLELKKHEKALADFNKVIELNPEYTLAYKNRGICYMKMGDNENANRDFRSAAQLGDKSAQEYLRSKGIRY